MEQRRVISLTRRLEILKDLIVSDENELDKKYFQVSSNKFLMLCDDFNELFLSQTNFYYYLIGTSCIERLKEEKGKHSSKKEFEELNVEEGNNTLARAKRFFEKGIDVYGGKVDQSVSLAVRKIDSSYLHAVNRTREEDRGAAAISALIKDTRATNFDYKDVFASLYSSSKEFDQIQKENMSNDLNNELMGDTVFTTNGNKFLYFINYKINHFDVDPIFYLAADKSFTIARDFTKNPRALREIERTSRDIAKSKKLYKRVEKYRNRIPGLSTKDMIDSFFKGINNK